MASYVSAPIMKNNHLHVKRNMQQRIIEAKRRREMTPTPKPGEYWRDRKGDVRGPLKLNDRPDFPMMAGGLSYTIDGRYYGTHESPLDLITRVYVTDWPEGAVEVLMTGDETYVDLRGDNLDTHTLRGLLIPIAKPPMTDAEKLAIVVEALQEAAPFSTKARETLAKIGGAL
jgi:hypothetical protein